MEVGIDIKFWVVKRMGRCVWVGYVLVCGSLWILWWI